MTDVAYHHRQPFQEKSMDSCQLIYRLNWCHRVGAVYKHSRSTIASLAVAAIQRVAVFFYAIRLFIRTGALYLSDCLSRTTSLLFFSFLHTIWAPWTSTLLLPLHFIFTFWFFFRSSVCVLSNPQSSSFPLPLWFLLLFFLRGRGAFLLLLRLLFRVGNLFSSSTTPSSSHHIRTRAIDQSKIHPKKKKSPNQKARLNSAIYCATRPVKTTRHIYSSEIYRNLSKCNIWRSQQVVIW